ncbi:MAG: hypothetical protein QXG00_01300 [Candidatus Woesearchaeota archaeon]
MKIPQNELKKNLIKMSDKNFAISDKIIVIIVFSIILLLGFLMRYKPYGYAIQHDYPMTVHSADANSRVSEAEGAVVTEQPYLLPAWFDDEKTDIVSPMPPITRVLSALITSLSGIGIYDSLYFIAVLATIGVAISFMLIFWKLFGNLWAGIISAILLVHPFEAFGNYLIILGMYPHVVQLTMTSITLMFFIKFLQNKTWKSLLESCLFFAFAFYTHSSLPILIFGLMSLIMIYILVKKQIGWKKFIFFFIISIILISPFLPILYSNWFAHGSAISVESAIHPDKIFTNLQSGHTVQLFNFITPILFFFMILGLIFIFFVFKNKKYIIFSIILFYLIFVVILASYLGFNNGQINDKPRYMLSLIAYPIAALGVSGMVLLVKNQLKINYKIIFILIFIIILIVQIVNFTKIPSVNQSLFSKDSYDNYLWVRNNIDDQKRILCIGCIQFEGMFTHKPTYLPSYEVNDGVINQMLDIAQNNNTKGLILTEIMGHSDWRLHWVGLKLETYGFRYHLRLNRSICEFDYWIFKDLGQVTPLINAIALKIVAKNNTVVHAANNFFVIKNNYVKGECI